MTPTKTAAEIRAIIANLAAERSDLIRQRDEARSRHAAELAPMEVRLREIDDFRIDHHRPNDILAWAARYEADMALPEWRRVTDGHAWYVIEKVTAAQFHCRPAGSDPRQVPDRYSRRDGRYRGVTILDHEAAVARFLAESGTK